MASLVVSSWYMRNVDEKVSLNQYVMMSDRSLKLSESVQETQDVCLLAETDHHS